MESAQAIVLILVVGAGALVWFVTPLILFVGGIGVIVAASIVTEPFTTPVTVLTFAMGLTMMCAAPVVSRLMGYLHQASEVRRPAPAPRKEGVFGEKTLKRTHDRDREDMDRMERERHLSPGLRDGLSGRDAGWRQG